MSFCSADIPNVTAVELVCVIGMHRTLAKLPVTLTGWHREEQVLRVPLFQRYRERLDVPFAEFKAILQVPPPCHSSVYINLLSCCSYFWHAPLAPSSTL